MWSSCSCTSCSGRGESIGLGSGSAPRARSCPRSRRHSADARWTLLGATRQDSRSAPAGVAAVAPAAVAPAGVAAVAPGLAAFGQSSLRRPMGAYGICSCGEFDHRTLLTRAGDLCITRAYALVTFCCDPIWGSLHHNRHHHHHHLAYACLARGEVGLRAALHEPLAQGVLS